MFNVYHTVLINSKKDLFVHVLCKHNVFLMRWKVTECVIILLCSYIDST
jgi:hypothetical protein